MFNRIHLVDENSITKNHLSVDVFATALQYQVKVRTVWSNGPAVMLKNTVSQLKFVVISKISRFGFPFANRYISG